MPRSKANKFHYILLLGLLTGTLDAVAALILNYPGPVVRMFQYIASGVFGESAFTEGTMAFWGLLFHYLIATSFCIMLLELHPKFRMITRNKLLLGLIYGVMIWIVMNYAILPITNVPKRVDPPHFEKLAALENILALVLCLGIPISFVSEKYYMKKALRSARRRVRSHS